MGLIRKTLMISTAGVVRGSSKKQRVAKASLRQAQAQTREARVQTEIFRRAEQQAERNRVDAERAHQAALRAAALSGAAPSGLTSHDSATRRNELIRESATASPQVVATPMSPEPPGWRPAPDGTIRWFDGFRLTDIQHQG